MMGDLDDIDAQPRDGDVAQQGALLLDLGVAEQEQPDAADAGVQDQAVVVGIATAARDGAGRAQHGELDVALTVRPAGSHLEDGHGRVGRGRSRLRLSRPGLAERGNREPADPPPPQNAGKTIDVIGVKMAQRHQLDGRDAEPTQAGVDADRIWAGVDHDRGGW